jgi:hypothetical protein
MHCRYEKVPSFAASQSLLHLSLPTFLVPLTKLKSFFVNLVCLFVCLFVATLWCHKLHDGYSCGSHLSTLINHHNKCGLCHWPKCEHDNRDNCFKYEQDHNNRTHLWKNILNLKLNSHDENYSKTQYLPHLRFLNYKITSKKSHSSMTF